ncbi:SCO2400 family protein [Streptomyces bottropensis]
MDYCSSCRRHLNGALVCPGCGAYAPDIAPATIDSHVAPPRPAGATTGSVMLPAWGYGVAEGDGYDGPVEGFPADAPVSGTGSAHLDADVAADMDADADMDVDTEGVPVTPHGRAARRRQLARWKKNQRRAVVATAVALVGGGLTVLGMDRQSTDRTQAATAPDAENLGSVEEQGSQRGRTPATETDDARRTADAPTPWTPSGDTPRDRSAANRSGSRAEHPNAPHTASATPSAERARTGTSGKGGTAADTSTDTGSPTDGATTPPATGDSGNSGGSGSSSDTGTGTGTGSDTGTGADSGNGNGNDNSSGTGNGNGTGASDGSSSDTATTSPSGLCLLGLVCVS